MRTKLDSHCNANELVLDALGSLGKLGSRMAREIRRGNHRVVTSVAVNPKGYRCWGDFARDYAAVSLLRKADFLSLGIDRKAVAIEKFRASEVKCATINRKFRLLDFSFQERSWLEEARRIIRRCLGKFSWDFALSQSRHGPGACVGLTKDRGHPWYKFGEPTPTVTGECLALYEAYASWTSLYGGERPMPKVVRASKVITVPKDARGDRTIAKEPLWNMFFQLGIGRCIQHRLSKCGINLRDQRVNQELARIGSIDGSLATLDLSAASDSVSVELVRFLLPDDWFEAIYLTRTHYASIDGDEKLLQKISSMGNGYTFALESLIFWALCTAAVGVTRRQAVSVYGDDLIVPVDSAPAVIALLGCCGFSVNEEKSFVHGPFRESCGKHYFAGSDVTPIFQKRKIVDVEQLLLFANSIRRLASRLGGMVYCHESLYPVWCRAVACLPNPFRRLFVPDGYGDCGLLVNFDECAPDTIRRKPNWVEGYTTSVLTRKYAERLADGVPALFCTLGPDAEVGGSANRPSRAGNGSFTVPLPRYTHRVVRLHVHQ